MGGDFKIRKGWVWVAFTFFTMDLLFCYSVAVLVAGTFFLLLFLFLEGNRERCFSLLFFFFF